MNTVLVALHTVQQACTRNLIGLNYGDMIRMDDATRKRQFRAALALDGMTARDWARSKGIDPGYLAWLLAGKYRADLASGRSKRTDELVGMIETYAKETLDRFCRERLSAAA